MRNLIFGFVLITALTLSGSAQIKEAQKVDEFGNTNCDDYGARVRNLLLQVNNSSGVRGYVFVYEGELKRRVHDKNGKFKRIKYVSPEVGMAKELIGYLKNQLLFINSPPDKIIFVEAGFREKYTIEFWIVPNELDSPKPKPTLKKIKQRKQTRKPVGFCGEL